MHPNQCSNNVFYHTGVSNRIRFVTLDPDGRFTSDGYKADTVDLKSVRELLGRVVELYGHLGTVKEFLSTNTEHVPGKYVYDGRYLRTKDLDQFNQLVRVYWKTGMNPSWVNVNSLKFV